MASKVFFTDMTTKVDDSLLNKLDRLIRKSDLGKIGMEKKFVAIKMHFGEFGNLAFLRPNYVKVVSNFVKEKGGIPFITDCSTLYVGMRKNGIEHMADAELNGFNSITTGCQLMVGDGVKGSDDVEIPIKKGIYCKTAKIGRAVADADVIISLSHFKGHELTGYGGALKNLGMGCASRRGKMELHTSGKPHVVTDKCHNCKKCSEVCAQNAISYKKTASIDKKKCAGCGRCISMCPFDAIANDMDEKAEIINGKIAEYAKAVIEGKPHYHIMIANDISPVCDCHSSNDVPIVPNVGMFASGDPVAIDLACVEMVLKQPMMPGSVLDKNTKGKRPKDILNATNPRTDWKSIFVHAKKIGMGDGSYEITTTK